MSIERISPLNSILRDAPHQLQQIRLLDGGHKGQHPQDSDEPEEEEGQSQGNDTPSLWDSIEDDPNDLDAVDPVEIDLSWQEEGNLQPSVEGEQLQESEPPETVEVHSVKPDSPFYISEKPLLHKLDLKA